MPPKPVCPNRQPENAAAPSPPRPRYIKIAAFGRHGKLALAVGAGNHTVVAVGTEGLPAVAALAQRAACAAMGASAAAHQRCGGDGVGVHAGV